MTRNWTLGAVCAALLIAIASGDVKAATPTIKSYKETIELRPDGTAVAVADVVLGEIRGEKIELPVSFPNATPVLSGPGGPDATASIERRGDVRLLSVTFKQPPPAEAHLQVVFKMDKPVGWKPVKNARGVLSFEHIFPNLTTANTANYNLKVLLPPGYLVRSVTRSVPRASGEDVEPPYSFSSEGDHVEVLLRSKRVAPGGTAAIAFTIQQKPSHQLPMILLGAVLAALALYLKRDSLTRADFKREVAS